METGYRIVNSVVDSPFCMGNMPLDLLKNRSIILKGEKINLKIYQDKEYSGYSFYFDKFYAKVKYWENEDGQTPFKGFIFDLRGDSVEMDRSDQLSDKNKKFNLVRALKILTEFMEKIMISPNMPEKFKERFTEINQTLKKIHY